MSKLSRDNQAIDIGYFGGRYGSLGYRSASVASREGRSYVAKSGEALTRYDRIQLINQSRDFIRNNPIYKGMIARAVGYIVGNGFGLQAKTGDKNINVQIEKLWKKFWKKPEIRNILSGRKAEKMVCSEMLTVGDTGILKTNKGKIQLIESEQIVGKKGWADDGIAKDSLGTPISFSIGGYGTSGQIDKRTIKTYSPDVFLFLTDPERPSSIRGVPPCQSSFPMLHRINDVCDSEAIAWQLLARMAVSITREKGEQLGYNESKDDPQKPDGNKLTTRLTELDYALIFHGKPGEEIKGIERNVPGKNFSESLIMFLRLLGLPLGLPLEVILLDWTKSNYSQSRAVLEQAFTSFIGWQYEITDFFLTPVYEWFLRSQIRSGPIKETETIFEHDWIRPTFPWIDQLKEALAWGEKLDRGLTLHNKALKSLGTERDDEMTERQAEVMDAIERAQNIKTETGVEVPWQIFAGLQPPNQTPSAGKAANDAEEAANKKQKKDDKNKDNSNADE